MSKNSESKSPFKWVIAALAGMLAAMVLSPKLLDRGENSGLSNYRAGISEQIQLMISNKRNDISNLEYRHEGWTENLSWLEEQQAVIPDPSALPTEVAAQPALGCSKLNIMGNKATLLCFKSEAGVYHLITVDLNEGNQYLKDLPSATQIANGVWEDKASSSAVTQWTKDNKSYTLIKPNCTGEEFQKALESKIF